MGFPNKVWDGVLRNRGLQRKRLSLRSITLALGSCLRINSWCVTVCNYENPFGMIRAGSHANSSLTFDICRFFDRTFYYSHRKQNTVKTHWRLSTSTSSEILNWCIRLDDRLLSVLTILNKQDYGTNVEAKCVKLVSPSLWSIEHKGSHGTEAA